MFNVLPPRNSDLAHAQQIGVPANSLHPVLQQQQQLLTSNPPFNVFGITDEQATRNYYTTLAARYRQLNAHLIATEEHILASLSG